MAKQEQHDMREYAIVTPSLTLSGAARQLIRLPVPASGQVVRCLAAVQTVLTIADAAISFILGGTGTSLKNNGTTATLTIPFVGSALGDTETIDFDPLELDNLALEVEDLDLEAATGVLAIRTDGGPTVGAAIFTVVISP